MARVFRTETREVTVEQLILGKPAPDGVVVVYVDPNDPGKVLGRASLAARLIRKSATARGCYEYLAREGNLAFAVETVAGWVVVHHRDYIVTDRAGNRVAFTPAEFIELGWEEVV